MTSNVKRLLISGAICIALSIAIGTIFGAGMMMTMFGEIGSSGISDPRGMEQMMQQGMVVGALTSLLQGAGWIMLIIGGVLWLVNRDKPKAQPSDPDTR